MKSKSPTLKNKKVWTKIDGRFIKGEVIEEYVGSRTHIGAEFSCERYVTFKPDGGRSFYYDHQFETTPNLIFSSEKEIIEHEINNIELEINGLKNRVKMLKGKIKTLGK